MRTIRRGEIVAVKGGHILDRRALGRSPARAEASYIQIDDDFYIGAVTRAEVPRNKLFINHSCEPNVGLRGQISFVALRDVAAGEELTYDWAMEEHSRARTRCTCGTSSCRKILTGQDWKIAALRRRYRGYFSAYLTAKIDGSSPPLGGPRRGDPVDPAAGEAEAGATDAARGGRTMITCAFENGSPAALRHVVLYAIVEKDGALLFVRRAERLSEGGKWGLPGGFLDRDETLAAGTLRELREETGWEGEVVALLRVNSRPNRPRRESPERGLRLPGGPAARGRRAGRRIVAPASLSRAAPARHPRLRPRRDRGLVPRTPRRLTSPRRDLN